MKDKKASILFVDDETLICDIFSEYFQLEGFDVLMAHSGEEAIELVLKDPSQIDVIVTDIKMSNGDGIWFIDKLNEHKVKKLLFIMTAHLEYSLEQMKPKGVMNIFHKPAKFELVHDEIERCLKDL